MLGFFQHISYSTGRQGHNVDPDGIEFGDREHVSFSASLDGGWKLAISISMRIGALLPSLGVDEERWGEVEVH
jgi:hypothetical protein